MRVFILIEIKLRTKSTTQFCNWMNDRSWISILEFGTNPNFDVEERGEGDVLGSIDFPSYIDLLTFILIIIYFAFVSANLSKNYSKIN